MSERVDITTDCTYGAILNATITIAKDWIRGGGGGGVAEKHKHVRLITNDNIVPGILMMHVIKFTRTSLIGSFAG